METIQQALASRDLVAWALLIVIVLIVIKLLKSLGAGFVLLLLLIGVGFILAQFFPDFIQPLVDYVKGGWLGD
ncbi:MAG: hypothetical protein GVY36_01575 [Verrucomicrobia bacterium]|jgi:hypothetical protein|nr:hypothetical protein [Verrucomicrobiota bacterium]